MRLNIEDRAVPPTIKEIRARKALLWSSPTKKALPASEVQSALEKKEPAKEQGRSEKALALQMFVLRLLAQPLFCPERSQRRVKIVDVQKVVARQYNSNQAEINGPRRTRDIVRPRQIAMYLARTET